MFPATGLIGDGIAALRSRAKQWALDVRKLQDTAVPPELVRRKADLINRAKTIKNSLESVLGTIDELAPIQMGALPVIGVAAIAAAGAAVTAWYVSYNSLMADINAFNGLRKDLQAGGASAGEAAKQAAAIVSGLSAYKPSFFKTLSLPLLLVGGAIAYSFVRGKV